MNQNVLIIILVVFIMTFIKYLNSDCKLRNRENFTNDIQLQKEILRKENFGPACSSIYGRFNPRCASDHKKMYHIGYYSHKEQRFPILDMIMNSGKKKRYIIFNRKIKPFAQKYWDKIFYFKKPFPYEKNVPYSFIYNFNFVGRLVNPHIKRIYHIYEKKMNVNLYKYVLFENINGILKYSFSLPDRNKINPGDVVFIRDKASTYGPFTFLV